MPLGGGRICGFEVGVNIDGRVGRGLMALVRLSDITMIQQRSRRIWRDRRGRCGVLVGVHILAWRCWDDASATLND